MERRDRDRDTKREEFSKRGRCYNNAMHFSPSRLYSLFPFSFFLLPALPFFLFSFVASAAVLLVDRVR